MERIPKKVLASLYTWKSIAEIADLYSVDELEIKALIKKYKIGPASKTQGRVDKAEKIFKESQEHVTEDDLKDCVKSAGDKIKEMEGNVPNALAEGWENLKLLFGMLSDYWNNGYPLPWGAVAAIVSALLYFVSPIDVIPDFIPFIGYIDDAAVIALCIAWLHEEIEDYKKWLKKKSGNEHEQ